MSICGLPEDILHVLGNIVDKPTKLVLKFTNKFFSCFLKDKISVSINEIIESGYFNVMKWAIDNKCPVNESAVASAAYAGNDFIVDWLMFNKYPYNNLVCDNAAYKGHTHILKLLNEDYSLDIDKSTLLNAAIGGNYETFMYVDDIYSDSGFFGRFHIYDDDNIIINAAIGGNIDILKFVLERQKGGDLRFVFSRIVEKCSSKVFEWLLENNYFSDCSGLCLEAAKYNNIKLLEWAVEKDNSFDLDDCINVAINNDHGETVAWLCENCDLSEEIVIKIEAKWPDFFN